MRLGLGIDKADGKKLVSLAKQHGISGLMMGKWQFDGEDAVREFNRSLTNEGLEICQWGAWEFNPMRPTDEAREAAVRNIRLAGELGVATAVAPGGSANPDHPFCAHPDNFTREGIARAAESLKPLAKAAEESGVTLALEPHFATVLTNWKACVDVLDAIGSEAVKIQFDAANMVRFDDYWKTNELLEDGFRLLQGRIAMAHAKDIRMANELHLHLYECPAGEGCLDYVTLIRLLEEELGPAGYLIIEHTPEEKMAAAVAFIRECAAKAGVSIL